MRLLLLILFSFSAHALTFNEALVALQKHESIEAVMLKSKATSEEADLKGSWGDPKIKIAAKNYPNDSFRRDQSPMTGIEFGVSQKISLTTKYGNIEDAFESLAKSFKYQAEDRKEGLLKGFWEILILKRKIEEELKILNENLAWISKILKVSKKLYANGKTSQQAILDIQIRKSEIESQISNKNFELSQLGDKINYLIGSSFIDSSSVPWKVLHERPVNKTKTIADNRELSLKEKINAKEFSLTAAKQNYIPDMTVSLGITKRSNIDGNGDFVGASVSFPIPFSGEKYSKHGKAVQEKYIAVKNYENYKRSKIRNISVLKKEIAKIKNEIKILNTKTIEFATNSRSITSKSYGLGNSSYIELLQSELKLQKILMQKVMLEAFRDMKVINLKYVLGEQLNE